MGGFDPPPPPVCRPASGINRCWRVSLPTSARPSRFELPYALHGLTWAAFLLRLSKSALVAEGRCKTASGVPSPMARNIPVCKCRYAAGVCPRRGSGVAPPLHAPALLSSSAATTRFCLLRGCCRVAMLLPLRQHAKAQVDGRKRARVADVAAFFITLFTLRPSLCTTPPHLPIPP